MQLRAYLIPLYAAATLFPRALSLPPLPETIQLTELIFPIALWSFHCEVVDQIKRYRWFTLALALYIFGNMVSALVSGGAAPLLEAGARVYLGLVGYVVLAHLTCYGGFKLVSWWRMTTIAVAGVCILMYTGALLGVAVPPGWVYYIVDYPIFGSVYRLRGTATVYGMMYMLLLPGLFFAYADFRAGRGRIAEVLVILIAMVTTFAKENVLFLIGALLLEIRYRPAPFRAPLLLAAAGLVGFLYFNTHFLLEPRGKDLTDTVFTSGRTIYSGSDYVVAETNYTANKRAALLIGSEHPWLGVGPGRYSYHTEALVGDGHYPAHLVGFDPHSAWTGAFAETGLLGLLGLIVLVTSLIHYRPEQWTVPAVLLFLFLIASVFKDVMNFRGLWVLVGLYLATGQRVEAV